MDEKFISLAINEAKKSAEQVGCGAVVVRNGKVIAKAFNNQRATKDATAHAEINAIKKAGRKLGNKNLDGTTIYCSCEPCVMCLSAIVYAKIERLVYKDSLKNIFNHVPVNIDLKLFLQKTNFPLKAKKI